MAIEAKIKADGLDGALLKGQFGLRTGRLFSFINPTTPDDPESLAKFRAAAKDILKLSL
jgi:hypothetical protein